MFIYLLLDEGFQIIFILMALYIMDTYTIFEGPQNNPFQDLSYMFSALSVSASHLLPVCGYRKLFTIPRRDSVFPSLFALPPTDPLQFFAVLEVSSNINTFVKVTLIPNHHPPFLLSQIGSYISIFMYLQHL